jgi:hypothetical protein
LLAQAQVTELLKVGFGAFGLVHGQLEGKIQHAPGLVVEIGLRVVVHHVVDELSVVGVLTEEPSVRHRSITIGIRSGHHSRDALFLDPGQR